MSGDGERAKPARISPARLLLRRFGLAREGTTAVEFGLVAVPFLGMLLGLLEVAFAFFATQGLETALADAARRVLTGQAQANAGITTPAQFRDTYMCNPSNRLLPSFIDCNEVKVDVRTIQSFKDADTSKPVSGGVYDTSGFVYQPGATGSIVVIRAVYPMPMYVSLLGTAGTIDLNGRKRILIATATFRNEPF